MTIVELLAAVGADNLAYQKLDECIIRADRVKRGTNITFGTDIRRARELRRGRRGTHALRAHRVGAYRARAARPGAD